MSDPGERNSKLVAPTAPAPILSREEVVRREAENGLRQADRMFEIIEHALSVRKLRLRPSTLIELNRLAVTGLVAAPGAFRSSAIVVEHSQHVPPPHEDVPGHVDDLCDYIYGEWDSSYATHLAAYVLWRLSWIHPFEDGNGRTALNSSRSAVERYIIVHGEEAIAQSIAAGESGGAPIRESISEHAALPGPSERTTTRL